MNLKFANGSLIKAFIDTWRRKYREYVKDCLTSGFIPRTFLPLQLLARLIATLWVFVQLGRITLIGRENLKIPGRIIYCPNHRSMLDALVMYACQKRFPRYMTAYEEMQGFWGLKAIILGAFGCFPVDRTHGKTVLEPGIKVLMSGQPLVIFPEGKISPDGSYLPFKKGAAIIANAAFERLGMKEKVGIVPINISYHCPDPETATARYPEIGFRWRCGVTVTVGKPIWLHELASRQPDDVTACLRAAMKKQTCPAPDRQQAEGQAA